LEDVIVPKLRNNLELTSPRGHLPGTIASSLSKGITEKTILEDQHGIFYLAKTPDELTVEDVFSGYLSEEVLKSPTPETTAHIFSLQLERAFLEILVPRMVQKLFRGAVHAPDTFLHVSEDKSIWILSRFMNGFCEFLANKDVIKARAPLFDVTHLPKRAELHLTEEEAQIVGQLYAVALVFNLWDLLNSKLLNSGYCLADHRKRAAIVDFGCGVHISYKGRHNDTLALDDPLFVPQKKIDYTFFGKNYRDHYRHGHALPFDKLVAPMLPHTIIPDLFDMSKNDLVSQKMLEGFTEALTLAERNLTENPRLLEEAFEDAYNGISLDSLIQAPELKAHLNSDFYSLSGEGKYVLSDIIQQRLSGAIRLIPQFRKGISATAIHEQVRDHYYFSQQW
jgi:hypothetical protein